MENAWALRLAKDKPGVLSPSATSALFFCSLLQGVCHRAVIDSAIDLDPSQMVLLALWTFQCFF